MGRGPEAPHGARHSKKSHGVLREGVVGRYRFIDGHRGRWPVRAMCRALQVSPGGYYGSPRIHAELAARGEPCNVNTVARIMRRDGIAARARRKFRCSTDSNHDRPVAGNVLDRRFQPADANRAWAADITYIPTREGWLHLAAVEDLHSRRIVGWSMSERIDSRLVVDALEMAVARRLRGDGLVAHSDRGSRYASEHYRRILSGHGITCSMSRRANCWDDAPMESFFASLKKEPATTARRLRALSEWI